jgi:hypothetical protein
MAEILIKTRTSHFLSSAHDSCDHSDAYLDQERHALWTHLELKSCNRLNKKVRLGMQITN